MKDIKFRGQTESGTWVYGFYMQQRSLTNFELEHYICSTEERIISDQEGFSAPSYEFRISVVKPETVGQYVPIKNGSGDGLYEGDLVRFDADYCVREKNLDDIIGEFAFETDRYILRTQYGDYDIEEETDEFYYKGIVVGNIYDNPELIK
jgi:hypothetical protein